MKLASLVAAAACLLLPLAGHAGVIYEWRPLDGNTPQDITLRLEFTQAAVDGGAFSFSLPSFDMAPSYPDLGLIAFHYAFPGLSEAMDYRPREQQFRYGLGALDLNLRFETGGFLSGWIRANDQNSHIVLQSVGTLFTVLDANSDAGMAGAGCGWPGSPSCSGATGYLQARQAGPAAQAVPEPHNIALLGLGALVLFGARRRA
ncbi:PEP-CTERM sorting domain-containing protein [Massilia sp. X63]|uniref:PEP-CTERM sorting domain-containing protein n=1 Tax=Massilia sp. X63 TaxID=3237285 RepID=UPI0034DD6F8D